MHIEKRMINVTMIKKMIAVVFCCLVLFGCSSEPETEPLEPVEIADGPDPSVTSPNPSATTASLTIIIDSSCSGRGSFDIFINDILVRSGLSAGAEFITQQNVGATISLVLRNPNFNESRNTITIRANGFRFTQGCNNSTPTPTPTPTPIVVQPAQISNLRRIQVFNTNRTCTVTTGTFGTIWAQEIEFIVTNPNNFGINYFYRTSLSNGASTSGSGTIFQGRGRTREITRPEQECSVFAPVAAGVTVTITETRQN